MNYALRVYCLFLNLFTVVGQRVDFKLWSSYSMTELCWFWYICQKNYRFNCGSNRLFLMGPKWSQPHSIKLSEFPMANCRTSRGGTSKGTWKLIPGYLLVRAQAERSSLVPKWGEWEPLSSGKGSVMSCFILESAPTKLQCDYLTLNKSVLCVVCWGLVQLIPKREPLGVFACDYQA